MTIQAVYQNGVFRPFSKPTLPEGTKVELRITSPPYYPKNEDLTHHIPATFADLEGIWGHITSEEVEELGQAVVKAREYSKTKVAQLIHNLEESETK